MNINLLLLPNRVSLKFASPTERDTFWSRLAATRQNGFLASQAAERVGTRTIRLHPDRVKPPCAGFEWALSNGEAVEVPVKAAVVPAPVPEPQPQNVITANPFGFKTGAAHKPLPGMTPAPPAHMLAPPVAPAPLAEVLAVQEPVDQQDEVGNPLPEPPPGIIPHNAETVAALIAPIPLDDPKPVGVHGRSKVMREWLERQNQRDRKHAKGK